MHRVSIGDYETWSEPSRMEHVPQVNEPWGGGVCGRSAIRAESQHTFLWDHENYNPNTRRRGGNGGGGGGGGGVRATKTALVTNKEDGHLLGYYRNIPSGSHWIHKRRENSLSFKWIKQRQTTLRKRKKSPLQAQDITATELWWPIAQHPVCGLWLENYEFLNIFTLTSVCFFLLRRVLLGKLRQRNVKMSAEKRGEKRWGERRYMDKWREMRKNDER